MRTRAAILGSVLTLTGLLAGCGAKTSTLTFRVTGDDGNAMRGARIRTSMLDTNGLPLPVSLKSLGETFAKTSLTGTADAKGEVRLTLLDEHTYLLEVTPPAFSELTEHAGDTPQVWCWFLDPATRALNAPSKAPNPPGLALAVAP